MPLVNSTTKGRRAGNHESWSLLRGLVCPSLSLIMSVIHLINTGILMGIIHVLTGPDHLSALATLCGTDTAARNSRHVAFCIGAKWGVGHSIGLLVVGGTLIGIQASSTSGSNNDDKDDDDAYGIGESVIMSKVLEIIVGVFMLTLGTYGIFSAIRNNKAARLSVPFSNNSGLIQRLPESNDDENDDDNEYVDCLIDNIEHKKQLSGSEESYLGTVCDNLVTPNGSILDDDEYNTPCQSLCDDDDIDHNLPTFLNNNNNDDIDDNDTIVHHHSRTCYSRCNTGLLAMVAGVVHGVAGPGGVLGVIPAVQLHNVKLACIYLITFCVTSTIVMGTFASCYGTISGWLAGGGGSSETNNEKKGCNRVHMVEMGSAMLSICVGIVWLILLSLGKLDDIFP